MWNPCCPRSYSFLLKTIKNMVVLADEKAMKTNIYAIFALAISTALMAIYAYMKDHFHDPTPFTRKISYLEKEIDRKKFQAEVAQLELQEFRHSVAVALPDVLKNHKEETYSLRKLASVTQEQSADYYRTLKATNLFEKGKRFFRAKDFDRSNKIFETIIKKYNYTVHLNEAYFLLTEGHFQMSQFDECVHWVREMVAHFPETELTGFALLRLGKIYEFQDRPEEAIRLYKTVLKSFPQRGVASQARRSMSGVGL